MSIVRNQQLDIQNMFAVLSLYCPIPQKEIIAPISNVRIETFSFSCSKYIKKRETPTIAITGKKHSIGTQSFTRLESSIPKHRQRILNTNGVSKSSVGVNVPDIVANEISKIVIKA